MKNVLCTLGAVCAFALPIGTPAQVAVQASADQASLLASPDPHLAANKRFVYDFWREVFVIFRPFLVPYTVGSTIGAVVLSALAYPLALAFITSRRRLSDLIHSKD